MEVESEELNNYLLHRKLRGTPPMKVSPFRVLIVLWVFPLRNFGTPAFSVFFETIYYSMMQYVHLQHSLGLPKE